MIEIIGLIASATVLISISVKSSTTKSNIIMRIINTIGSGGFIWYGFALNAYSTAVMNIGAISINLYYIIKLIREIRSSNKIAIGDGTIND